MIKRFLFPVLLSVFCFVNGASALELDGFYKGVRPLGMGDAFTAIANDENAAFYNPAGLNSVKSGRVELINPLVEVSQKALEFVEDMDKIKDDDVSSTIDVLKKYIGVRQHARASLFPNYTRRNFEVGIIGQTKVDFEVHNPPLPYVDTTAVVDAGGVIALAKGFMDDRLQLGISGTFVQRQGISRRFTAADIASGELDLEKEVKSGTGIGVNLGGIYNLDTILKPSIGVSIISAGDMDFGEELGKKKQHVNLGLALHKTIWIINSTLAADYKDITGNLGDDTDKGKRLHLGAEFKFPKILSLRGGLNQGYTTYGATIDLWLLKISYARYEEEVGAYAGQRSDDRHVAQVSLGW